VSLVELVVGTAILLSIMGVVLAMLAGVSRETRQALPRDRQTARHGQVFPKLEGTVSDAAAKLAYTDVARTVARALGEAVIDGPVGVLADEPLGARASSPAPRGIRITSHHAWPAPPDGSPSTSMQRPAAAAFAMSLVAPIIRLPRSFRLGGKQR
jgi:hypothetical protein